MAPRFRSLSPDECRSLLARQQVGRLAYAYKQRVDIEPIHYALDGDWIHLRTQEGAKLSMLDRQPWVAFEVDEIQGLFEWSSVVVHGSIHRVPSAGGGMPDTRWQDAVTVIRRVVPQAFQPDDPTPDRTVLLRVHIDHCEGRAATPD